jgi:cytochrome b561
MATTAATANHDVMRYSRVAVWLHLLIGVAVVANIGLAMLTEDMPKATRMAAMWVHKPLGITILVLTVARILWRLTHKPPPVPAAIPSWQAMLGKAVHFIFYALLILLPLSGWIWMSAADAPISFFGLFDVPAITGPDKALGKVMHDRHEVLGLTMLGLVILHFLAALKHHYIDHTRFISRMNPFG